MRARLTLWFVLGIVLVTAAGAAGMYAVLSGQLREDLDSRLASQLSRYAQAVATASGESELAGLTESFLSGPQSNALRQNGYALTLVTTDGTIISNSNTLRLEEMPESRLALETGHSFKTDLDLESGELRVAGSPVVLAGTTVGAVLIAGSQGDIADTMGRLLVLLAIAAAAGCVVVGLGTWLLLGRALGPVQRITRTAAAISKEDLSRRIDYSGPKDEIGELALTMDAMLDRIQSAFAAQERFISDASHELRTPLTIVKGHLQVLDRQESPDPAFVKQEHALVIDELDRMNRLVADLLTLARATRNDFLRLDPVDLGGLLTSLVEQGPHLGDREWTLDSLPSLTLSADQDRLMQLLLNLMQNAVRHTETGQVIALGGSNESAGPGAVALWVRDEGHGMTEETRVRVFDRFYRGEAVTGDEPRLGLGLAIVKAIAEAHGGAVSVESTLGQGSRFTIVLPRWNQPSSSLIR